MRGTRRKAQTEKPQWQEEPCWHVWSDEGTGRTGHVIPARAPDTYWCGMVDPDPLRCPKSRSLPNPMVILANGSLAVAPRYPESKSRCEFNLRVCFGLKIVDCERFPSAPHACHPFEGYPKHSICYFVQVITPDGSGGPIKIGRSSLPVARRASLQSMCPYRLGIIGLLLGDKSKEAELHEMFADYRSHGEWYHPNAAITAFVKEHCHQV